MIRSKERSALWHFVFCDVLKDESSFAINQPSPLQIVQISFKPNLPKSNHNFRVLQSIKFALKIRRTIRKFERQRLVLRRGAARRSSNVEILQREAIVSF